MCEEDVKGSQRKEGLVFPNEVTTRGVGQDIKGTPATLAIARKILGQGKVISAQQSAEKLGMEDPGVETICYFEETLRQCAEQNQDDEDWRLIHCRGLSLTELRIKLGIDQREKPCFQSDNTWWLKESEDSWATYKPQAGNYLLNFKCQLSNLSWELQEKEIIKFGGKFERCNETLVAESMAIIFLVNGGEQIAKDLWHWGAMQISDFAANNPNIGKGSQWISLIRNNHIFVKFEKGCLELGDAIWATTYYSDRLGVVLARKFDF